MDGRKMTQIVAGAVLLAAATVSPLLLVDGRSATGAEPGDSLMVEEPAAPASEAPAVPSEPLVPPALTPRAWPVPTFEPAPMRGLLAAGVTVPPAPGRMNEPPAPLVAEVSIDETPFVLSALPPIGRGSTASYTSPACCDPWSHPWAPKIVESC